jgi:hypothetical protein
LRTNGTAQGWGDTEFLKCFVPSGSTGILGVACGSNHSILIRAGGPDPVLGDLNGDGVINGADLGSLLGAWGAAPPGAPADLNSDGVVNGADLGALLGAWTV